MEIISWWQLYLWTRLDSFNHILTLTTVVLVIVLISAGVIRACIEAETYVRNVPPTIVRLTSKTAYISVGLMLLLSVAIPSQKDAAMIWVIPKLANSKVLQQEAGDIYKLAKSALKETLGQSK